MWRFIGFCLLCLASVSAFSQFQTLGGLPKATQYSQEWNMSPDGSIIVGTAEDSSYSEVPFIWTEENGMEALPNLIRGTATGVSSDGSVVAGNTYMIPSGQTQAATGFFDILGVDSFIGYSPTVYIVGLSGDGKIGCGSMIVSGLNVPAIFSSSGGASLALLSGAKEGFAGAISADGKVIAGYNQVGKVEVPVYWSSGTVHAITLPTGFSSGGANAVSGDGTMIGGTVSTGAAPPTETDNQAFLYDVKTGRMVLFQATGASDIREVDAVTLAGVDDAGDEACGFWGGLDGTGTLVTEGFIWTPNDGDVAEDAGTFLSDNGAGPDPGILFMGNVSEEGDVFAGTLQEPSDTQLAFRAVLKARLIDLTVSKPKVVGGTTLTGEVTLNSSPSAQISPVVVDLESSDTSAATVPTSISFLAGGSASQSFNITTFKVAADTDITITAHSHGVTLEQTFIVQKPLLTSLSVTPGQVFGGIAGKGTVFFGEASDENVVVTLSSNELAASVPASITVAAGKTSAQFTIATLPVAGATTCEIKASTQGVSFGQVFTVEPAVVSAVKVNYPNLISGQVSPSTVTLTGEAPPSGAVIALTSSNTAAATVPASIKIAYKATAGSFSVTTLGVSSSTSVTIKATYLTLTKTAVITVLPAGLSSLAPSVTSIVGGNSFTVHPVLNGLAGPLGTSVNLALTTSATSGPTSCTVLAQHANAVVNVATKGVAATTSALLRAEVGTVTKSCTVSVQPATILSIKPSTSAVVGGAALTFTVSLNGQAPPLGALVSLSSSSVVVSVVSSARVLSGHSTVAFTVTTKKVATAASVSVYATYGLTKVACAVSVDP